MYFIDLFKQICLELECFKIVICLGNHVFFLPFEIQVSNYNLKLFEK